MDMRELNKLGFAVGVGPTYQEAGIKLPPVLHSSDMLNMGLYLSMYDKWKLHHTLDMIFALRSEVSRSPTTQWVVVLEDDAVPTSTTASSDGGFGGAVTAIIRATTAKWGTWGVLTLYSTSAGLTAHTAELDAALGGVAAAGAEGALRCCAIEAHGKLSAWVGQGAVGLVFHRETALTLAAALERSLREHLTAVTKAIHTHMPTRPHIRPIDIWIMETLAEWEVKPTVVEVVPGLLKHGGMGISSAPPHPAAGS
jgi:hypothetical protein